MMDDKKEVNNMPAETGELDAKIAGQEISLKGVSISTIATVATLIAVCLIAYMLFIHQQQSRDTNAAFVDAIKEQTGAIKEQTALIREQNCLISLPEGKTDPELCRRLSR